MLESGGLNLEKNTAHLPHQQMNDIQTINLCICTSWSLGSTHGGIERVRNFAKNVSLHGANVYLVDRSLAKSLHALFLDNDSYQEIKEGKFYQRRYPLYTRFLLPGIIKFLQVALSQSIKVLTGFEFFLPDPYLIVKLFFVCKTEKIDLIQCEFPTTSFSSFIVKRIIRIPLIYDAHNIESDRLQSFKNANRMEVVFMKRMELLSCHVSDSIFSVSQEDKKRLMSWGIPGNKITVVPNSVELEQFSPEIDGNRIREKYQIQNSFVMIFHGYLSYPPNREAVSILLDMFPNLQKQHDSICLLLVGQNPPQLPLPDHVIVTGFVKNVKEYIAAADLAVVPLLSGGGTKIKMLEYMACGKAIVSTVKAAEGLDLENEEDVLMCKYPDSEFVNLVGRAIRDSNLRQRIGASARKKAEEIYGWEKNAKRAVCVYHNLLSTNTNHAEATHPTLNTRKEQ